MKAFTSKPTNLGKDIDFELNGEHYTFKPPKTTTQLVTMMQIKGNDTTADLQRAGAMLVWFSHGLNREHEPKLGKTSGHTDFVKDCQSCKVQQQLENPDDDLELDTVMEIIAWLMEEISGRPTM